jgi:hypothetical protein
VAEPFGIVRTGEVSCKRRNIEDRCAISARSSADHIRPRARKQNEQAETMPSDRRSNYRPQKCCPDVTRHSPAVGIDLQTHRRRAAGLYHRRAHQAGQPVAGFASRRTDAVGLGGRSRPQPGGLTKSTHAGSSWYASPLPPPPTSPRPVASASRFALPCARWTDAAARGHAGAPLPTRPRPAKRIPQRSVP